MSDVREVLDYEMYASQLFSMLQTQATLLNIAADIIRSKVTKANGEVDAIMVAFTDTSISVPIYVTDLYKEYQEGNTSIEGQAKRELELQIENRVNYHEIEKEILSADYIEKNLFFKVRNADMNREMANDSAVVYYHDLILVPYVKVHEDRESTASFRLTSQAQGIAHLSDSEVQRCCYDHLKTEHFTLQNMGDMLREMFELKEMDEAYIKEAVPEIPMYILSNESGLEGAVVLASQDALAMAYEQLGEEYYIIPSSIHECILFPRSQADPRYLKEMCEIVNGDEKIMRREDVLSNNIYRFDGKDLGICITDKQLEAITQPIQQSKIQIHRGMQ